MKLWLLWEMMIILDTFVLYSNYFLMCLSSHFSSSSLSSSLIKPKTFSYLPLRFSAQCCCYLLPPFHSLPVRFLSGTICHCKQSSRVIFSFPLHCWLRSLCIFTTLILISIVIIIKCNFFLLTARVRACAIDVDISRVYSPFIIPHFFLFKLHKKSHYHL